MKMVYIVLAILGVVLPYTLLFPWMMENGFPLGLVMELLFVNEVSSFFAADLLVTAFVFTAFVVHDGITNNVKYFYVPLILAFLIGLAFAFPVYLLMKLQQTKFEVKE